MLEPRGDPSQHGRLRSNRVWIRVWVLFGLNLNLLNTLLDCAFTLWA